MNDPPQADVVSTKDSTNFNVASNGVLDPMLCNKIGKFNVSDIKRLMVYFFRLAIYSSHSEGISCFFWVLHSLQQGTRLNFSDLPPRAKGMI